MSEFEKRHPLVLFEYALGCMVITMITMHPVLIMTSLLMGVVYAVMLQGRRVLKAALWIAIPVFVFAVLILPFFSHSGITPLFYVNHFAVTREAVLYGVWMTALLVAIFLWLQIASSLFDSEKLIYMFGRGLPAVGLMVSMVFRMLPLLRHRYQEIHEAQMGLGRYDQKQSVWGRCHSITREISVLLSLTLEDSVETSIAMESRGYGVGRRSCFHLFSLHKQDIVFLLLFTIIDAIIFVLVGKGCYEASYFPEIWSMPMNSFSMLGLIGFIVVGVTPPLYDLCYQILDTRRRCK